MRCSMCTVKSPLLNTSTVLVRQNAAVKKILAERDRQDDKWGMHNHSPEKWLSILGEEFGEACKAALHGNRKKFLREMVQISAVALAALEFANLSISEDNRRD